MPSLLTRADFPARDDDPAAVEGEPLLAEDLVEVDDEELLLLLLPPPNLVPFPLKAENAGAYGYYYYYYDDPLGGAALINVGRLESPAAPSTLTKSGRDEKLAKGNLLSSNLAFAGPISKNLSIPYT